MLRVVLPYDILGEGCSSPSRRFEDNGRIAGDLRVEMRLLDVGWSLSCSSVGEVKWPGRMYACHGATRPVARRMLRPKGFLAPSLGDVRLACRVSRMPVEYGKRLKPKLGVMTSADGSSPADSALI